MPGCSAFIPSGSRPIRLCAGMNTPANRKVVKSNSTTYGIGHVCGSALYVKQWDHQPAEERYSVQVAYGGQPVIGVQPEAHRSHRRGRHVLAQGKPHSCVVRGHVQDGNDDQKLYQLLLLSAGADLLQCRTRLERTGLPFSIGCTGRG